MSDVLLQMSLLPVESVPFVYCVTSKMVIISPVSVNDKYTALYLYIFW